MTRYKHTQIGYINVSGLFFLVALYSWLIFATDAKTSFYEAAGFMALILIIVASFATLQTSIDENYLRIKFGYGVFRRKFLLSEIQSVKQVKNHWYYGWGIRLWLRPYMWIFNVSGFDAVELVMKNGQIYRIGTDVPKKLEEVIRQNIKTI